MGSVLACSGFAYSEDSPEVVSQGGPLGATSIGDQNLGNAKANVGSSNQVQASNTQQSSSSSANERELLLKLQEQVQQLQGQLQQIKAQKSSGGLQNTSNGSSQFTTYSSKVDGNKSARSIASAAGSGGDLSKALIGDKDATDIMQNVNANDAIVNLGNAPVGGIFNQNGGIDVGGAPAITTGGQITFLGAFSGNNSIPIGQIPSSLFASTLLGQREKFDDYSVFFGGLVQADAQAWFGNSLPRYNDTQSNANGQNIYLTGANLYFLSNIGHYVTAQFDFDTDESGAFGLGNAFVVFGNLDTSPFFVTAGRNKLSVGAYGGGGTWVGGVTGFLAPSKVTNISVNYKDEVWNWSAAVFGSDDKRANFSTGLFYADAWTQDLAAGFNVGYVYNIAGAGNSSIKNFLAKDTINKPSDNVGAINVDGVLTYTALGGLFNFGAGWASTTTSEEFNGAGKGNVLAGAWYGAVNYSLNLGGRNTNFGASYGQTYNSKEIPMGTANASPAFGLTGVGIQNQLVFNAQRAYFDDNVLIGPEWAYQKLYTGEYMNTLTLDLVVYI